MEKGDLINMKSKLEEISKEISMISLESNKITIEEAKTKCNNIFSKLIEYEYINKNIRDKNFKSASYWFDNLKKKDDPVTNWIVIKEITNGLKENLELLNKENNFN
jgi:hypothetical protein